MILILLPSVSSGMSQKYENQSILSESSIKKKSFKGEILQRIRRTLSKDLRKCPVVVAKIKLFRKDDEFNVDEEWTVYVCQETKKYFVSTSDWPKGYWIDSVELKKERIARERKLLKISEKLGTKEGWKDDFFYIDEIEAMDQDGEK